MLTFEIRRFLPGHADPNQYLRPSQTQHRLCPSRTQHRRVLLLNSIRMLLQHLLLAYSCSALMNNMPNAFVSFIAPFRNVIKRQPCTHIYNGSVIVVLILSEAR